MEDLGIKIDEIFLSKAVGERFELLSYDVRSGSKPGDNFLSLIYSIKVELRERFNSNKPIIRYLLLKCYPNHPSRQEFNNQTNIFHKELEIYKTWFPELIRFQKEDLTIETLCTLPYPPFVYGNAVDFSKHDPQDYNGKVQDPLQNVIVMEDMKRTWGFRMTDRRESLDIHHMRLVIPALAKVHALSWAYKHHVEQNVTEKYPFLQNSFKEADFQMWVDVSTMNMDQAIGALENELGKNSPITQAAENFKLHLPRILRVFMGDDMSQTYSNLIRIKPEQDNRTDESWNIINHGDCWSNNMLFRYDQSTGRPVEVILVDLQLAQHACITNDLVYVIYGSSRKDLRQAYLTELLQAYYDTFNTICDTLSCPSLPGFTMDSFKARFHKAKLAGYMFGIVILPMILKEEEDTVNMEQLDPNKDIGDLFKETIASGNKTNTVYNERILELTRELYEEGIL